MHEHYDKDHHFDFQSTACEEIGDLLIVVELTTKQAQGEHKVEIHLNLIDPCLNNLLSFKSTLMPVSTDYKIYPTNSAHLVTFPPADIGFDPSIPACPIGYTIDLVEIDTATSATTAIDASVFQFSSTALTFNTDTRDVTKAGPVDFQISIRINSNAPKYALSTLEDSQTFKIELIDWCASSPTITAGTINT